jgi:hypothetical protein
MSYKYEREANGTLVLEEDSISTPLTSAAHHALTPRRARVRRGTEQRIDDYQNPRDAEKGLAPPFSLASSSGILWLDEI